MEQIIDHIIFEYEKMHPYKISFALACLFMAIFLFYTSSVEIMENIPHPDKIEFINIDTIRVPKRVARKTISTEKGEISDQTQTERAKGSSDTPAVDLAFYPNITPPKPIRRLKKIYPKSAREQGIDAILFLEILIDINGRVRKINFIRIRLNKELPEKARLKLSGDFQRDARKILIKSRWSPSIVAGKKVPVKYLFPLEFRLEN